MDGILRVDYRKCMTGYALAGQNGWMAAHDSGGMECMKRIPAEEGGDLYFVNGNMTKLADAGAFAAKKK